MIGDQLYIAGLLESASKIEVGKTWMLERDEVIHDLAISIDEFNELQHQIEVRIPGKWHRAMSSDRNIYVYMRTA